VRNGILVAAFLPLCSAVSAQSWVIEQVDSVSAGQSVFIRRCADGRVKLCYERPDTTVWLACKDSVWRYECVPVNGWLSSYEVGPHGEEAVSAGRLLGPLELAIRSDSAWQVETLSFRSAPTRAVCAFDTAGWPRLAYAYYFSSHFTAQLFLQKSPSGWQEEDSWEYASPIALKTDGFNRPVLLYDSYFDFPADKLPWYTLSIYVEERQQDTWGVVWYFQTWNGELAAWSVGLDTAQVPHFACYVRDALNPAGAGFYLDDSRLADAMQASALAYDYLDRPQLACRMQNRLDHWYKAGTGWRITTVPGNYDGPLDMLLDANDQPVILTQYSGTLYLVRGEDIVGLESVSTVAPRPERTLLVAPAPLVCLRPGQLTDPCGRIVQELRSGPNDVSRLAPGVYFVRDARAQAQAQAVTKVVVTR